MVISSTYHPRDLGRTRPKPRAQPVDPSSTRLGTLQYSRRRNSSGSSTNSASWGLASEHESFKSLVENEDYRDDLLETPFARAPLHRSFSFHGATNLRGRHLAAGSPYLHQSPDDSWELESLRFVDLSTHQRRTISCLWATKVAYYFALGTLPVVLPASVESRGFGAVATGTLFSIWAIAAILFWPLWKLSLQKFGTKNLLSVGVFLTAIAYLLYGCLFFVDYFQRYIVLAYVCRGLEGAGFAAIEIASNAKILAEFPRHESGAYSSVQRCIGIGLTLGIGFSGFLFSFDDVAVPFFVNGILLLLVWFFILCLLERRPYLHPDISVSRKRRRKFLRTLSIYAAMFMLFFSVFAISSLFPILQPHLEKTFDELNLTLQGIVLAVIPFCFAFGNALWQWLITQDYVCGLDCVNIFGLLLIAISLLLLGPLKAFQIPSNLLWLVVLCFIVIGGAMSMVYIASLNALLEAAEIRRINKLAAYSMVSTTTVICMLFGIAIGPSIGGMLFQFYYDFPTTLAIIAAILLAASIVDMLYALFRTAIRLRNYNRMAAELRYRTMQGGATSRKAPVVGASLANRKNYERNLSRQQQLYNQKVLSSSVNRPLLTKNQTRTYGAC